MNRYDRDDSYTDEPPLVVGGQGRTNHSVRSDAGTLLRLVLVVGALAALYFLTGANP